MNNLINPAGRSQPLRRSAVSTGLLIGLLTLLFQAPFVMAQKPHPQSPTAVSPLLGWQPPHLVREVGVQPAHPSPALAARGLQAPRGTITGTVMPPSYRPGVVKQFEETSYYIKDVEFITTTVGWAVGYPHWDRATKVHTGTIVKTTDGGESWTAQAAGVSELLRGVDFVDAGHGWAVGFNGTILHTEDGGGHWQPQAVATSDEFMDVVFADANTGWATSLRPVHYDWLGDEDNWEAGIWHTGDGGDTWVQQTVPDNASILHAIDFVDAQTGWAVGVKYIGDDQYGHPEHRAAVYHTSDGGQTWYEQYSPELEISLTSVDFVDGTHGWVAGFPTRSDITEGAVFRTSDGGETWERQEPGDSIYAPLWDIRFVDQNRGYAVGFNYVGAWGPPVWRTLDGGDTWENVRMRQHDNEGLFGVAVFENQVIAMGDHDYRAESIRPWDSCEWVDPEPPCYDCDCLFEQSYINTHYRFEDVFFVDENNGWAVGSRSYLPQFSGQVIFHTSDGGQTWETQYEHAPPFDIGFSYHRLDDVFFADSQHGWAVGASETVWDPDPPPSGSWEHRGAILHTTDGGLHWEEQGEELYEHWDLEFFAVQSLDDQNGWALATKNFPSDHIFLARTANGGSQWDWVDTGITGPLAIGFALVQGDVVFTDAQHGWAVGGLGKVIHTDDGGAHWVRQDFGEDWRRLFAVEMLDNQEGWIAGEGLFHTSDGGDHWNMEDVDVGGDLQDIQFVDALNGWLAGDNGVILVTRDGGRTWNLVDNDVSSYALRGISFINPHKGWLVGDYGTILTTIQIPYWSVFLPLVTRE